MKERRKITVELLDKLLEQAKSGDDIEDPGWDELMEIIWGDEKFEGAIRDILILARVAVDHLNVVIVTTKDGYVGEVVANVVVDRGQVPK